MSTPTKRCDICHQAVVSWPQIFTVIGPRDLCGTCYWRYRALLEKLGAFFSAENTTGP